MEKSMVKPAEGKLGILVVGCGAVATTFMTGVLMTRKGLAKPIASMTQYDKIRVGSGEDKKYLHYDEIVPMAKLSDIVFGSWDVYPQNAYQAAMYAEVLKEKDINPVRDELEKIVPMKAAFDKNYAKRLDGDNVKNCKTRWEMVEALREDIRNFKASNNCARIVVLWAASTEIYVPVNEQVHYKLSDLEAAMRPTTASMWLPPCATPTPHSPRALPSSWVPPTPPLTFPPCGNWPRKHACPSPARTSRPARRS